jgi:uncharacterized protein YqhQ
MAFGNGVLMRSKGYWAWARADGTVVEGRVNSLLERSRLLRLPLLRSLVALVEMLAFAVRLQLRNGLRANLQLVTCLALWAVFAPRLGSLAYTALGGGWISDLIAKLVVFLLGLVALQGGMGVRLWRYHGAEHKAVNAHEAGCELDDLALVAQYSRIHNRCGTNLVAIIVAFSLAYLPLAQLLPGSAFSFAYSLLTVTLAFELFRMVTRCPERTVSRAVLCAGRTLQSLLTTREPKAEQLQVACRALRRVAALEAEAECDGLPAAWLGAGGVTRD